MSIAMHSETAIGELRVGQHTLPMQDMQVKGKVQGLLYNATVKQTFRNDRDNRIEAVYTFPLPPKAAVHGFKLRIGGREVEGVIQERAQARRAYQQAVSQGHRAALMEEERSDIFTTTVGNIGPDEEITVSFELSGPLSCFGNTARLRFPLVVAEVYVPGQDLAGGSVGDGVALDTDEVPDASRITPPRLAPGAANPVNLQLSFEVEPAGLQIQKVESTCHFARVKKRSNGSYRIGLLPGMERLDKAFVLEVSFQKETLQSSLLVDRQRKAFALTVVPPSLSPKNRSPRDLVIVLDRSGSMDGWAMVAARQAAARIVESLTPEDRFGLIAFDTVNDHFDRGRLHLADDFFKMKASEWLRKVEARGGTEMAPALQAANSYLLRDDGRDCHILLITDGEVGNDSHLMQLAQSGIRISTVGIGCAAREGLLNRMADASGGVCSLIPNEAELEKSLVDLHRRMGRPFWMGLSLVGSEEAHRSPKFWDVWEDMPTTFFGRYEELPTELEVSGWLASEGHYTESLKVVEAEDELVFRAWARSHLLDLEDLFVVGRARPEQLVKLSVEAQVLCRFTAFTAIDKEAKVETEEELQKVVQAVETPAKAKKRGLMRPGSALRKGMLGSKPTLGGAPSKPLLRCRSAPPAPASSSPPPMDFLGAPAPAGGGDLFAEEVEGALFDCAPEPCPVPAMPLEMEAPVAKCEEILLGDSDDASSPPVGRAMLDALSCEVPSPPKPAPLRADTPAARARTEFRVTLEAQLDGSNDFVRWSEQVDEMVQMVGEMKRSGDYPPRWAPTLAPLMNALLDYREALEDHAAIEKLRGLRQQVMDLLRRLT